MAKWLVTKRDSTILIDADDLGVANGVLLLTKDRKRAEDGAEIIAIYVAGSGCVSIEKVVDSGVTLQ